MNMVEYCEMHVGEEVDGCFTYDISLLYTDAECKMPQDEETGFWMDTMTYGKPVGECVVNAVGQMVIFECNGEGSIYEHVYCNVFDPEMPCSMDCSTEEPLYSVLISNGCTDFGTGYVLMTWENFCMQEPSDDDDEEEEGECVSGDEYPGYCELCDDFDHSVCPEDDKCCCAACDEMIATCEDCAVRFDERGGCDLMRRGEDADDLVPEGCPDMCEEAVMEHCGIEYDDEEEGECVSGDEYPEYCTLCDDFDHSVCPEDDKCCCAACDEMMSVCDEVDCTMEVSEDMAYCCLDRDIECNSNMDCVDFCNFDFGTSGNCEFCANIESTCAEDGFDTDAGTAACMEICEAEEEEEPTDCTDCVSQDDYERLYRMVEAQAEQIAALESQMMDVAGLEATVNDVDTQLTNLATCLSYDSSYEPEPEPEMTMEPSKSPTMMLNMISTGVVCPNDGSRTFKNKNHESAEECYLACEADADCMYFSFNPENNDCIGCTVAPDLSNSYTDSYLTYLMPMGSRRQLSELELLRAENAALKEALSQARRN